MGVWILSIQGGCYIKAEMRPATTLRPEIGIRPGMQVQRYDFFPASPSKFEEKFKKLKWSFQKAAKQHDFGFLEGYLEGC